ARAHVRVRPDRLRRGGRGRPRRPGPRPRAGEDRALRTDRRERDMNEDDLRLDGNAAAGVLAEIFAVEMTAAIGTCAHCGAANPIGAVQVYAQAPGTVLRCP